MDKRRNLWTFTGGCHYDDFCGKYKDGCSICPVLKSKKEKDEAFHAQQKKSSYLAQLRIQLVGCSNWITEQANESLVGKRLNYKAICIPNPTNAAAFKLYEKEICKQLLEIESDKKLILFGAVNAASDKRKGAKYLIEALKKLNPEEYILGIFGSKDVDLDLEQFEYKNFGRVNDDLHLALIYNAADVFVAPSLQENLANTVMESLTCGTPVVAFEIGGMPDMISHGENGYLAKPYESADLAKGIEEAVALLNKRESIRQKTLECFSEETIGETYVKAYEAILS